MGLGELKGGKGGTGWMYGLRRVGHVLIPTWSEGEVGVLFQVAWVVVVGVLKFLKEGFARFVCYYDVVCDYSAALGRLYRVG